jgi:predicted ATPase
MSRNIELKPEPWDAAQRSFLAHEERMHKKWGWGVWQQMCAPELASKYRAARERYLDAIRDRNREAVEGSCSNLVKGLKMIDEAISREHKPDDVFYLHARIEGRNFYLVSDQIDMQRILPIMKGKDPVVYTMDEVVRIIAASCMDAPNNIKQMFPGAKLQSVQFQHNKDQVDDQVPF